MRQRHNDAAQASADARDRAAQEHDAVASPQEYEAGAPVITLPHPGPTIPPPALGVPCPQCHAKPAERCHNYKGQRCDYHGSRKAAADAHAMHQAAGHTPAPAAPQWQAALGELIAAHGLPAVIDACWDQAKARFQPNR